MIMKLLNQIAETVFISVLIGYAVMILLVIAKLILNTLIK